ncbi:MAG: cysteine hydrolase [Lysobacteraceae bacterium]|nr:MAG: cysteine hydrolase [Xanthomonadaceae bacterium]
MPAQRTALLVIDMINRFDFEGGRALGIAASRCVPVIARLRARFDAAKAPVIYVNDNFMHWLSDFRELVAECRMIEGPAARIAGALSPRPGDYQVLKPKHSAFLGTPLEILLAQLEVRRSVLAGIAADSCILATAQDANMRDFRLWIPADAVAAQTPARRAGALGLARQALGADVRSTRVVEGLFPQEGAS